jgi:hypothetical protein
MTNVFAEPDEAEIQAAAEALRISSPPGTVVPRAAAVASARHVLTARARPSSATTPKESTA